MWTRLSRYSYIGTSPHLQKKKKKDKINNVEGSPYTVVSRYKKRPKSGYLSVSIPHRPTDLHYISRTVWNTNDDRYSDFGHCLKMFPLLLIFIIF